jgi:VRR-NUC domain
VTEKQWQRIVIEAATALGWKVYHTYDSRRSQPGFPDLVMTRRRRTVYVELKTDKGRLTHDQREWIAALQRNPANEVFILRPKHWPQAMIILKVEDRPMGGWWISDGEPSRGTEHPDVERA